jgi:hypothetical protein
MALVLGGQTYPLKFDWNALVETEIESRSNLLAAIKNLDQLSGQQLRALLLGLIRGADPDCKMTLSEAGQLITFTNIVPIVDSIAQALLSSTPEDKSQPANSEPAVA